jgi:sulfur carrier protein
VSATPQAIVRVNGEMHTLHDDTTVAELLLSLGHAPESVAVAVNGDFVPRATRRPGCVLQGHRRRLK